MGVDWGGYLRRSLGVSPGKFVRYPFLSAVSKLDKTGENSVACANAMRSAVVGVSMAALALWVGCVVSGTRQRRDWGLRVPVVTVPLGAVTRMVVASKVMLQPASHSCPTDNSVSHFRAGTMWT